MTETQYVYLPMKPDHGELRCGFIRKALTNLTDKEQEFHERSKALIANRHAPETSAQLKALVKELLFD